MAADLALHLVLDLRRKEEEEAQKIFVQALNETARCERQLQQLKDFKAQYAQQMEHSGRQGFTAVQFNVYQDFINKLDAIEIRQAQELEQLRLVTEQRRLQYLERQKQRKIIETLIKKHELERQKAEQKAEQKLLDEYVTARAARRTQV